MPVAPSPGTQDVSAIVLLIEDDADTREMYSLAFAQHGFRAMAAATADEGLIAAHEFKPSAIVTDVGFPGRLTVFDMMDRLRLDQQTRHIPVIAVTGYDLPRGRQTARFQRVLLKPVPPDVLIESVRTAVEHSAFLRERAMRLRARGPQASDRPKQARGTNRAG